MPIYTYGCKDCGYEGDYLVKKIGGVPEGCAQCEGHDLSRVYKGQTFAAVTGVTRITPEGGLETSVKIDAKLTPGVYLTAGLTEEGRIALNVSRVTADGTIDGSVTGTKPAPSSLN